MSKVIVLNSGGFDSVCMIEYLYDYEGMTEMISLFFDYGQLSLKQERECARKLADRLNIEHQEIALPLIFPDMKPEDQYLPMRNLIFLSFAISIAEAEGIKTIYSAIVENPPDHQYTDTQPEFYESLNQIAKRVGVEIATPFLDRDKETLGYIAIANDITSDKYFSCNVPVEGEPCGKCGDCVTLSILDRVVREKQKTFREG